MAEREGFEPSVPLLAVHTISSRAPSASSDISPHRKKAVKKIFYSENRYKNRYIAEIVTDGKSKKTAIQTLFFNLKLLRLT